MKNDQEAETGGEGERPFLSADIPGCKAGEKGFNPGRRVEAELLSSEATGPLFRAQEAAGLRSLFEQFLRVFETIGDGYAVSLDVMD